MKLTPSSAVYFLKCLGYGALLTLYQFPVYSDELLLLENASLENHLKHPGSIHKSTGHQLNSQHDLLDLKALKNDETCKNMIYKHKKVNPKKKTIKLTDIGKNMHVAASSNALYAKKDAPNLGSGSESDTSLNHDPDVPFNEKGSYNGVIDEKIFSFSKLIGVPLYVTNTLLSVLKTVFYLLFKVVSFVVLYVLWKPVKFFYYSIILNLAFRIYYIVSIFFPFISFAAISIFMGLWAGSLTAWLFTVINNYLDYLKQ